MGWMGVPVRVSSSPGGFHAACPLVLPTLSLIGGILLGAQASYLPWTTTALLAWGAWRIGPHPLFLLQAGRPSGISVVLLLWGFWAIQWYDWIPPTDLVHQARGERLEVVGWVDAVPRFEAHRTLLRIQVMAAGPPEGGALAPATGHLRLRIYDPQVPAAYGQVLRFVARVRPLRGFHNPGGWDFARYLAWQGIRTGASLSHWEQVQVLDRRGCPLLRRIYHWREQIRHHLDAHLPPIPSALLQALVVGATGALTPSLWDAFQAAGLIHILSISGSHLGMLTLVLYQGTRWGLRLLPSTWLLYLGCVFPPSRVAALVTLPPVTFYAFLAGGQVATLRALVMVWVFLLARILERPTPALNSLAGAALLVLLHDPRALFDLSFQFSYLATLALIVTASLPPRSPFWKSPRNWLWNHGQAALRATLAATLATEPLVAHHFQVTTWVGPLANLLLAPGVGLVLVPLGLGAGVASLWIGHLPWATLLAHLAQLLWEGVQILATFPGVPWRVPSPPWGLLLPGYLLLGAWWYSWKAGMILALAAGTLWGGGVLWDRLQPPLAQVTFLDVGQGDAVVVTSRGQTLLVDAGGFFSGTFDTGRALVAPYLWNQGIADLDYIVISHPQHDHARGALYLLETFSVGEVWVGWDQPPNPLAQALDQQIQSRGILRRRVYRGMPPVALGACEVRVLHPDLKDRFSSLNDRSVVLQIQCGPHTLLLPGDLETQGLQRLLQRYDEALESTLLKVPHHGGRSSALRAFVTTVCPQVAVVSVGWRNPYHHPAPETVERYRAMGTRLLRTDQVGAVQIRLESRGFRIQTVLTDLRPQRIQRPLTWRGIREELHNGIRLWWGEG